MARLLEFAQLTRSSRTLVVLAWKWLGFGVLLGGATYLLGWRIPEPSAPPSVAHVALPPAAATTAEPSRAVPADTSAAACHAALKDAGVSFRTLPRDETPGVAWPIELSSAVGGVLIRGATKSAPTNYLDCRLALALLAWAPRLHEQGVVALRHLSIYRQDAVVATTHKPSGHAFGLAIDVARFDLRDGRALSVRDDWRNRDRGANPCRAWPDDADAGRALRKLVCDAYGRRLFQSVVTPHANPAHADHVHLELRLNSEAAWLN